MRYLTNCLAGDYRQVKLLYSVSFAFRIKRLWLSRMGYNKLLKDHSIEIYRKKLAIVALQRNSRGE